MKAIVLVAAIIATAQATSIYTVFMDEWENFKVANKRHFRSNEEEYKALRHFVETKDVVAKHNIHYETDQEDYTLAVNRFADLAPNAFDARVVNATQRFKLDIKQLGNQSYAVPITVPKDAVIPDEIDWNARGAVNDVLDQGNCESYYTISTVGALEAQVFVKSKVLPQLSIQQLVDCSTETGNDGCNGGTAVSTLKYIHKSGLTTSHLYPYKANAAQCRVGGMPVGDKMEFYYYMTDGDEQKLKYAVSKYGPVIVGINASPRTFQLYSSGIYNDKNCNENISHMALLVGYGTDHISKLDYWIIKNSYGNRWGEKGYMRLQRSSKKICGIGSMAIVPMIVKKSK